MRGMRGKMMTGSVTGLTAMAVVFGLGALIGLARAYIAHRTVLHAEREASARSKARATGLVGLAERHRGAVRIVERDRDGHREVELGRREWPINTRGEELA
jgi:hypothetical protein